MRVTGKTSEQGVVRITKVLPCFRHLGEGEIEDGGGGEVVSEQAPPSSPQMMSVEVQ